MKAQRTFHSKIINKKVINADTLIFCEGIFSKHLKGLGRTDHQIAAILQDYYKITSVVIRSLRAEIDRIEYWTLSSILWMILMAKDFAGMRSMVS